MAKKNARRNRRARIARQENKNSQQTMPVVVARAPATQSAGKMVQSGMDRLVHVEDISKFKTGELLFEQAIVPGIASRLGRFASLFQRVRFDSLRFEIRTQVSTTTSGGYVAAFVRDPDDFAPEADVLAYLTGQAGSKTANWWQSVVIGVGKTPDLFYTSQSPTKEIDPRFLSPGKLVVACDGAPGGPFLPPTNLGSLTILMHWSATFSEPSVEYEGRRGAARITLPRDCQFWDIGNQTETTYRTALIQPGGSGKEGYVKPADLGIAPGTIWRTRPYSFVVEGPTDNYYKCVNTQYVVVFDSTDGYIRPAVKCQGRIVDATSNFGTFVYHEGQPDIAGDSVVFYKDDEWVEVDASGEPIDSESMTMGQIRRMVADKLLVSPTPPRSGIVGIPETSGRPKSKWIARGGLGPSV